MDEKRKLTALTISLMEVVDPPIAAKFAEYAKTGKATKQQLEAFADFRSRAFAQQEILSRMHLRLADKPGALIHPNGQPIHA